MDGTLMRRWLLVVALAFLPALASAQVYSVGTQKLPTNCANGQSITYTAATGVWACATDGAGTVTSVSVTTANGVSGSVATATTTPAITLTLGAITPTTVNGNTFTTGTYTLTGAAAKTLTFSNSITLAGTDATVMTFPTTTATIARADAAQTFTGIQTFGAQMTIGVGATSSALTDFLINPTTKASGNLIDAQVNSSSKFSVTSTGRALAGVGTSALPGLSFVGTTRGFFDNGATLFGSGGSNGLMKFGSDLGIASDGGISWTNAASNADTTRDTMLSRSSAGVIQFGTTAQNALGSFLATSGTLTGTFSGGNGGTPTVGGSGTIVSGAKDLAGRVTTATTGVSTITVTFSQTFPTAPVCWATNETTANIQRASATTTVLTITGTTVSGDTISYGCKVQ